MADKQNDFFKIEDHFKETDNIPSIPVFENHLTEVPRFTIAIPTYKRNKYLREALESAINQITNEPYEIIVVDNNPERDDDTELLMTRYKDVKGLSYYKNSENLGMFGNINRCFTINPSQYIILLHDDDVISKNFLEYANYSVMNYPDAGIIQTSKTRDRNNLDEHNMPPAKYEYTIYKIKDYIR